MIHLTDQEIHSYYKNTLTQEKNRQLLEHTSHCTHCAGRLADLFPEEQLLSPPAGTRQQIFQTIQKESASEERKKGKQDFLIYTTKILFAVSTAVFLIFSGGISAQNSLPNTRNPSAVSEDYKVWHSDMLVKKEEKQKKQKSQMEQLENASSAVRESTTAIADSFQYLGNLLSNPFSSKENRNQE